MTADAPVSRRRLLVLGGRGLLGEACVTGFRRHAAFDVDFTDRQSADATLRVDVRRDARPLWELIERGRYDLIVNAIGVLKDVIAAGSPADLQDALFVNAMFPHELVERAAGAGARVIHVSTDAVFAGRAQAPYDEAASPAPTDAYGAMKWLGEPRSPLALSIRCSIVGRRTARPHGLIDWFLALPAGATVSGYSDYRWTPVTAPQAAAFVARLADPDAFASVRDLSPVIHLAPNPPLSKWDLLDLLNERRGGDVRLERAKSPAGPVDLTLATRFAACRALCDGLPSWQSALREVLH